MDHARARELLSHERARLEEELRRLTPPSQGERSDFVLDSADAGDELVEEERDAAVAATLQQRLAAVERAEGRLAAGTYGCSVRSGEQIPDERLEADPAAELTVEEQRRLEGAPG